MSYATEFCIPKLSFEGLVFFDMVGIVYILMKIFLLFLNSRELRNLAGLQPAILAVEKTTCPKDTSAPSARKLSPVRMAPPDCKQPYMAVL